MFGKKKHEFDDVSSGVVVDAIAKCVGEFAAENNAHFEALKKAITVVAEMFGELRSEVVKVANLEKLTAECQEHIDAYKTLEKRFGPLKELEDQAVTQGEA